jgi:hypothetical protein
LFDYASARLREDPHLWARTLCDELEGLGFTLSYPSLTRNIRARGLRPATLDGFDIEAAADLAARCHRAAIERRWATTMRFYAGPTLLAIDELGYLPLPTEAASALFQVVSQRCLPTIFEILHRVDDQSAGRVVGRNPGRHHRPEAF